LNDLSHLRAPGWARVIADLSAPAADDTVFLLRLLCALGQVSGARQAIFFTLSGPKDDAGGTEPKPAVLWPLAPDLVDAEGRMTLPASHLFSSEVNEAAIEHATEIKSAVRAAASTRQAVVFGLDTGDRMYDAQQGQPCIVAVPIPGGLPAESGKLPLHGVITLTIDGRSRPAMQTTLALVEVLAGYVYSHAAQQALRRTRSATAALDLAARLIAAINTTEGFKGCTLQFVNDLCRQLAVDRVAMGWVHGAANAPRQGTSAASGKRSVLLIALSDTENLDRRMAMARKLESAMDECLDQEQTVLYPVPPAAGAGSDAVLSQAITHAHRELASSDAKLKVASFPLRVGDLHGDRIVGVILVESAGTGAVDPAMVELVQSTLDLVAPVLAVRHSDDRLIALRTWDWAVKTAAWAVGPKHTVWKAVGILVMIATFLFFFVSTTYRIGSPMELQARERRTLSVPFDGTISAVAPGIEAGRKVEQGQLMVELDTRELRLGALEAASQLLQYEKQADESLKKGELAEAQQAEAKAEQSRARLALLQTQIERSRVVAPISGMIISGDLKDKVGSAIKLGEKLFEVADLSNMVVIAKVSDSDIAFIRPDQTGEVSPKANPAFKVPFVVERIVPLSQADEGQNAFEVHCRLIETPAWFRPGMEGQARFNTQDRSIAWIASRRILDTLKVWLWW